MEATRKTFAADPGDWFNADVDLDERGGLLLSSRSTTTTTSRHWPSERHSGGSSRHSWEIRRAIMAARGRGCFAEAPH
jgi:hypothetical protein